MSHFFFLLYLFAVSCGFLFPKALADSSEVPSFSEEQITLCKIGRIDILREYLGGKHRVVMACEYKKIWEESPADSSKAKLSCYFTVAKSTDKDFPVGKTLERIYVVEGVDNLSPQQIDCLLKVEGRLWYFINPKLYQADEGASKPVLAYQYGFLIDDELSYKNIAVYCKVLPSEAKVSP